VVARVAEDPVAVGGHMSVSAWLGYGRIGWRKRGKTYRILDTPVHLSWACWRAICRRSPS
jgi:hypothetical protein